MNDIELQMNRMWFGLRPAPAQFSTISGEIVGTLQRRSLRYALVGSIFFFVYMDDLFIFSLSELIASLAVEDALAYLQEIGAEVNEKTRPPAQRNPLLGLVVDTSRSDGVELSLPADKAYSCCMILAVLAHAATRGMLVPRFLMDKIVGKLGHACEVVVGGQRRLVAIRDAMQAADAAAAVDLSACRKDLEWWIKQLCSPIPTRLSLTRTLTSAAEMVFGKSDASGNIGAAIVIGNAVVFWFRWDPSTALASHSIQAKEIFPFVVFLRRFGHMLRGLTILYATDNGANANALRTGSLRDAEARPLLFEALEAAEVHGFRIHTQWNPRENNDLCDRLSKAPTWQDAAQELPV